MIDLSDIKLNVFYTIINRIDDTKIYIIFKEKTDEKNIYATYFYIEKEAKLMYQNSMFSFLYGDEIYLMSNKDKQSFMSQIKNYRMN